jgi:hypothetical protein
MDSSLLATSRRGRQQAKWSDEESSITPKRGRVRREEDLTGSSASVEEKVSAVPLLPEGEGKRRVCESDSSHVMENGGRVGHAFKSR